MPNEKGSTYPQNCAKSPIPVSYAGITSRGHHEWEKHGTCTTLQFQEYFDQEESLAERKEISIVRDLLNNFAGDSISISDIYEEYGGVKKIAISSNQSCQLQELTTCWEKLPNGKVGEQIDCPDHVLGSSRNSAILQGCQKLSLDQSGEKCTFISKEYLKLLKSKSTQL